MIKRNAILSIPLLFCFFWATTSFAGKTILDKESVATLTRLEDSLLVMADSMGGSALPDDRIDFCVRFTRHLKTAMEIPNSFQYPFTRLSQKIHIMYSEDKSFRIFNWLIAPTTQLRRYYGAIQMDSEEPRYIPLIDGSENAGADIAMQTLDNRNWYGCEIYKIMDQTVSGGKQYLLFGFNSNGIASNKKILDVLNLNEGSASFGSPVFIMPDLNGRPVRQNRVLFEYKKTAQIYVNYDAERKMIIFNRLASEVTDPNRKNTYIPTGQMDGLKWDGTSWQFVRDAVPVLKLQDGQAPIDGVMK